MEFNKYQSTEDELFLNTYPPEIQEQWRNFIMNVPYIQNLISPERPYAKDCPRDKSGRIIVDLTNPPIIEDTDYFRPSAINFEKTGKYCPYRRSSSKNSDYYKWWMTEYDRIFDGYVRESDGAWVPGDMYFFLNYCPIEKVFVEEEGSNVGYRDTGFPNYWEGHWLKYMYMYQSRKNAKHGAELSRRGSGKSYTMGSNIAKRLLIGESYKKKTNVDTYIVAYVKDYLNEGDVIFNKFEKQIDFLAENTEFPRKRLQSSLDKMHWEMGYYDLNTGTKKGSRNQVVGISVKDNPGKPRGKRGAFIGIEEMGSFPNLLKTFSPLRPSMEQGDIVFGQIYCQGTAGDKNSDFSAAQKMMYNPKAFNMYGLKNVYDIRGQGGELFTFFFPAYINRDGCYNKDGISDVTKAVLQILVNRYNVKQGGGDNDMIMQTVAENPIVPQEAILKTSGSRFPSMQLNKRLYEIDSDPEILSSIYVGTLVMDSHGVVDFQITGDEPIREYPAKDNRQHGAVEIYEKPVRGENGKVPYGRYIVGHDPVDNDVAISSSLTSTIVLDLWTDRIVAEYTGRLDLADDNFEMVRKMCLYYNAKVLYENNKKGLYAYFKKMNSIHLLAESPTYLKDQSIVKMSGYGNTKYGVSNTTPVMNHADDLINDWLSRPVVIINEETGEETTIMNLHLLKSRALVQELALYNPFGNFDRVRALAMVMLKRQEEIVTTGGNPKKQMDDSDYLGNRKDDFFHRNWSRKLGLASVQTDSKYNT